MPNFTNNARAIHTNQSLTKFYMADDDGQLWVIDFDKDTMVKVKEAQQQTTD